MFYSPYEEGLSISYFDLSLTTGITPVTFECSDHGEIRFLYVLHEGCAGVVRLIII